MVLKTYLIKTVSTLKLEIQNHKSECTVARFLISLTLHSLKTSNLQEKTTLFSLQRQIQTLEICYKTYLTHRHLHSATSQKNRIAILKQPRLVLFRTWLQPITIRASLTSISLKVKSTLKPTQLVTQHGVPLHRELKHVQASRITKISLQRPHMHSIIKGGTCLVQSLRI